MNAPLFNSFESVCKRSFDQTGWEDYCVPLRQHVEAAAIWSEKAARPVLNKVQWTWKKSGEHFGETGQFLLILLAAGIAHNLWSRMKKKENLQVEKQGKRQYRKL